MSQYRINTLVTAGPEPEKSTSPVSLKAPIAWGIRFRILLPGLTLVQEKFGGKFVTCYEKYLSVKLNKEAN